MTISIVGTGYVGLVTGAIFADLGHKVYCIDIDESKIHKLQNGEIPFYEPGLKELVETNFKQKRLIFTTNYSTAVPKSKVVFICVGTPSGENGEADLSYLFAAVSETAKYLDGYTLITIKSTVPIGVEEILDDLIEKNSKAQFELAFCPEFLKEGSAVNDARNPDRIVIGTKTKKSADILLDLFKHFNSQRIICDLRSAQMIKYAANAFLATKISYANMLANLCEKLAADVEVVIKGLGLDQRIGQAFLRPGVGFGGSCFPKDLSAFINIAEKQNCDFSLLSDVKKINQQQIDFFIEKITKTIHGLENKHLAVLGLAFKPNTDDIREAPALKIIQQLLKAKAKIRAYDPVAMPNTKKIFAKKIIFCKDPYDAVEEADALLVITEWNEFKELDLIKVKKLMANPVIIDGRNIYEPSKVRSLGFIYQSIGRV